MERLGPCDAQSPLRLSPPAMALPTVRGLLVKLMQEFRQGGLMLGGGGKVMRLVEGIECKVRFL